MLSKKIRAMLMAAVILVASLFCGITVSAKSTGISVSGKYSNGTYILQVYGLTKKQYDAFVNQEKGFRVNITSGDGKCNVFLATDLTKRSDGETLAGYKGDNKVYVGLKGNKLSMLSTLSDFCEFTGLYGKAPGKTYGFRLALDAGDRDVAGFLPGLTRDPAVKVTFEDVYRSKVTPGGLSSEHSVNAVWGDAPLTAERCTNGVQVSIPTENYYKYTATKGAEMSLTLKFGSYTVKTVFSGGTGYTVTADRSGKDYIDNVTVKGKLTEHGGITMTCTLSDKTGRKALSSKAVSAVFRVTANGRTICGSTKAAKLLPGGKTKLSTLTVEEIAVQEYQGKAITPQPVIRDGYMKLRKGTDYTITYKNNAALGTASIVLRGKGAYNGTVTVKFSIVPSTEKLASRYNESGLVLSWWKVNGAERYELEKLDGGEFKPFMTFTDGSLSVALPEDTTGSFRIRAVGSSKGVDIPGGWSDIIEI